MAMGRRARKGGDEQDAFSRAARRVLCVFDRAGVVKKTKQQANRRDRRTARRAVRGEA